jgi:hypothetical protein
VFPNGPFLVVAGVLAVVLATALPAQDWRVRVRHILIALVVMAVAVVGAVLAGMMFHVGIFGEPVMLD